MTARLDARLRRRLGGLRDPVVRTRRLELRLPDPARSGELVRLIGDRTVARWTLTIPYPYRLSDARAWLRRAARGRRTGSHLALQVVRRRDRALVGGVGLHHLDPEVARAEIGYWIGRPFRGQGYAREAAGALVTFAFRRLGFYRVEGRTAPGNFRSGRVLRAIGFRREGHLRGNLVKDGEHRDEILYARLLTDRPKPRPSGRRRVG